MFEQHIWMLKGGISGYCMYESLGNLFWPYAVRRTYESTSNFIRMSMKNLKIASYLRNSGSYVLMTFYSLTGLFRIETGFSIGKVSLLWKPFSGRFFKWFANRLKLFSSKKFPGYFWSAGCLILWSIFCGYRSLLCELCLLTSFRSDDFF